MSEIRTRLVDIIREGAEAEGADAEQLADAYLALVDEETAACTLAAIERRRDCVHNQRCRFTSGYLCEDCGGFFGRKSATYRRTEWVSELGMVLHNVNVTIARGGGEYIREIDELCDRLQQGCSESVIVEAELMVAKYGAMAETATVVLRWGERR